MIKGVFALHIRPTKQYQIISYIIDMNLFLKFLNSTYMVIKIFNDAALLTE